MNKLIKLIIKLKFKIKKFRLIIIFQNKSIRNKLLIKNQKQLIKNKNQKLKKLNNFQIMQIYRLKF